MICSNITRICSFNSNSWYIFPCLFFPRRWRVEQWWYSSITVSFLTTSGSSSRVSTSSLYWWRPSSLKRDTSTGTSSLAGVRHEPHHTHWSSYERVFISVRIMLFLCHNRNPHGVCDHLGGAEATLWWFRVGHGQQSVISCWILSDLTLNEMFYHPALSGVGTWMTMLPSGGWSRDLCWLPLWYVITVLE